MGDVDFQFIINNFEKSWNSVEASPDEKLRLALLALRETIKPTDNTFETDITIKAFR